MKIEEFFIKLLLLLFLKQDVSGVDKEVSVMEGDSVTLNSDVETNQQEEIKWYFNDIRIAQINGDLSKICTDVQCNEGTERFRDRLKLDHQTGSLTITNITNTDSGEYTLKIFHSSILIKKTFDIMVYYVHAAERDEVKRKTVKEGESVTLDPGVINPNDLMTWYFNDTLIAEITGDQSKISTDDQCKERFRDRLKLDHQTGSLTIMNIRNTDSGEYKLLINSGNTEKIFNVTVCGVRATELMKRKEGESVTLDSGLVKKPNDVTMWYFNDILIVEITGDQSKICTDEQCDVLDERFRDRLKLDHQTGSLTITNITDTDAGVYQLQISSSRFSIIRSFSVSITGASGADEDRVSVMEGDSVTLNTGVEMNQQDRVRWYFNSNRIAEIMKDQIKICTDDQCKERFRDRLKLDHQTGSLTITDTRNTDSGEYQLSLNSRNSGTNFNVTVNGVSDAERDDIMRKSVMEEENVTLDPGEIKITKDVLMWYFDDILIAEITGDQRKICTDDQCKERFRDRLKLDHQTGSLTITNTRNTDSGEYTLQINNSRFSIIRSFSVSVTAPPDSGLSSSARAGTRAAARIGICAAVVLLVAAAVIYCLLKKPKGNGTQRDDHHQENHDAEAVPLN